MSVASGMAGPVFVGGSRSLARLPASVEARLDALAAAGAPALVGDAPGFDALAQARLRRAGHRRVAVLFSGERPRCNEGDWPAERVAPAVGAVGYEIHAAKDREMARRASSGLMAWDGRSFGTPLNAMRLAAAGKEVVVAPGHGGPEVVLRSPADWRAFLAELPPSLREQLRRRATTEDGAASDP